VYSGDCRPAAAVSLPAATDRPTSRSPVWLGSARTGHSRLVTNGDRRVDVPYDVRRSSFCRRCRNFIDFLARLSPPSVSYPPVSLPDPVCSRGRRSDTQLAGSTPVGRSVQLTCARRAFFYRTTQASPAAADIVLVDILISCSCR